MTVSMAIVWLIILVLLLIIELATMGLTTIWFAGGALVACIVSAFDTPIWLQFVIFLVISGVLLWFTRPIAIKYFNKDRKRTNIESMVGREAIVVYEINNLEEVGTIKVGGIEWMARSTEKNGIIKSGSVVKIMSVEGVKLYVTEISKIKKEDM